MIHFCYRIQSKPDEIITLACQSKVAAHVEEPKTLLFFFLICFVAQNKTPLPDAEFVTPVGQIIWLIRNHFQEGLPLIFDFIKTTASVATAFGTAGVKRGIKSGIVPREEMSKLPSPASGQNILQSLRWAISINQK